MAVALRNADAFVAGSTRGRGAQGDRGGTPTVPPVVVTGAPGWLGTRFVEALTGRLPDVDVAAFVGPATPIRCLVQPDADAAGLTALDRRVAPCVGDLNERESLRELLRGAEGGILVHIAGLVHPARFTRDFERVNVDGTRHLLEAAEEAGVKRVVVVSSNSAIGCNPDAEHRFDEQSPYNPSTGYGRSKARMEALVQSVRARGRMETVVIRPPWFYGPHQPPRQTLFFSMIKAGKFPILGNGNQRRSMAYVDNICQGLALAAATPRANGETYWIADERPYTLNEIVETVERVLEEDFGVACSHKRLHLPALVGEGARVADLCLQSVGLYHQKIHVLGEMHQTIACSIEKATRELGYRPSVALREGMRRSIEWCIENGLWP
jgi:nucleoside-diphosphate-sugar epimerase